MKKITQITILFTLFIGSFTITAQTVTTLAGSTKGSTDAAGTAAQFNAPFGVATDALGNVYVADRSNHKIRKITVAGAVSTLAGSTQGFADANGTAAQFNNPYGVATDASGNVYVADSDNHKIRKITAAGAVSTLAGSTQGSADASTGTAAQFYSPMGVATDALGNVYVADRSNNRIRKITAAGAVTTLAGSTAGFTDANGTAAQFYFPTGVATDALGNVYVADTNNNNRIRKITAAGAVTTLAGSIQGFADATGTAAQFSNPFGVATDVSGNVYVADTGNYKIRKITTAGAVTTLAGSTQGSADGNGTAAQFNSPAGVATDASGNVYVADSENHRIRKITMSSLATTNFDFNSNLSVYPNPSEGIFNINLESASTIQIFDVNGKQILSRKIAVGTSQIDLSGYNSGIYILKATDVNNKSETTKLVKK